MASILVVEDDPLISTFIVRGLGAAGHAVTLATDASEAQTLGLSGSFDMVLLDMMLGDVDGLTVLRELRKHRTDLSVLVITGHPRERDVVRCLDEGADDYLAKPFRFEELLARVRARLRAGTSERTTLSCGDLEIELLGRTVTVGGRQVELTAREFSLLETFLRHPGQVLSREQLLSRVWGYDFDPTTNIVNVYVATLRGKIGADRIQTLRGSGYRIRASPATESRDDRGNAQEPPGKPRGIGARGTGHDSVTRFRGTRAERSGTDEVGRGRPPRGTPGGVMDSLAVPGPRRSS